MQGNKNIINKVHTERNDRTRAQGMVEFAMTLPLLLLLILGIIEFGRLLFVYSSVISAAREAARYGAAGGRIDPTNMNSVTYVRDCDGIRAAAMRIAGIAGVPPGAAGVRIRYDDGMSVLPDSTADMCPVGGQPSPTVSIGRGDRIEVTVTAQFQLTSGIVPIPPMSIQSTVRRSVIVNVQIQPSP